MHSLAMSDEPHGEAASEALDSEPRVVSHSLFPTTVHVERFAPGKPIEAFNEALVGCCPPPQLLAFYHAQMTFLGSIFVPQVARALAAYEQCWRAR